MEIASALFLWISIISSLSCISSSSPLICPHQSTVFITSLQSRCSLADFPNSPLEVGGDFLDRTLNSKQENEYTSVIFYASWCPFSANIRSKFELMSSMFPQIDHLAIEQSSAMPSLLSRYVVHSFPTILLVNRTSRRQFRGGKELYSLIGFYKRTTGLEPIHYIEMDQPLGPDKRGKYIMESWVGLTPNEILKREPYLVLSVMFLSLMGFVFVLPKVLFRCKAIWVSYRPRLNLEIFGETSQILGRVVQMVDMKRAWIKLRICKIRDFRQGAKNARVWAL